MDSFLQFIFGLIADAWWPLLLTLCLIVWNALIFLHYPYVENFMILSFFDIFAVRYIVNEIQRARM